MDTMTYFEAVEKALDSKEHKYLSFSKMATGHYYASSYWPNGDVGRDTHCGGSGATIAEAFDAMVLKVEEAKAQRKMLKTAAECKAAVLDLIREHDATPASFRDAIDALPVKP